MGIQVTVKLDDIIAAGLEYSVRHYRKFDNRCEGEDCYCQGFGCYYDASELEVNIPPVGWVSSYSEFDLVFDNKKINNNVVKALEDLKIPYVRG